MTQITDLPERRVFGLSTVLYNTIETIPLVIAKPPASLTPQDFERNISGAVHFRDALPSIHYINHGSRLTIRSLNTFYPPTILEFGLPINSVGIHDDSSNIVIHVLLDSYTLYSMIFTPEYLENPHKEKQHGWISECFSPSFQIRPPLYMHSVSATSLIFSLQDGGLLRLSNNGRGYNEHIFSDSSYFSSFKSILPWSGRPTNLVISIQASTSKNLLFTLSVDAKLKTWDITSGKLLAVNDTYAQGTSLAYLADPVPSNLMALHEQSSSFVLVTYCPQRPGLFKVFKGRGSGLEEIFTFGEEQPSSGIWRVFDLTISDVRHDGSLCVNVLWKSDTLMLVQTAHVSIVHQRVYWDFAATTAIFEGVPSRSQANIEQFIFESGRFPVSLIRQAFKSSETQELPGKTDLAQVRKSSLDRIKASISLSLDPETGNPMQEKYDEDVRLKLLNFAQICVELDRIAGEPHRIQYSPFTKEVLISQTSKISVLRDATPLEVVLHTAKDQADSSAASQIIHAALVLRDILSIDSWQYISDAIRSTSIAERTMSADDAMFLTYEKVIEDQSSAFRAILSKDVSHTGKELIVGIKNLMNVYSTAPIRRVIESTLGIDTYVATQHSVSRLSVECITVVMTYVIYTACSSNDADIYGLSALYVKYLSLYNQAALLHDSTTITCVVEDRSAGIDENVDREDSEDIMQNQVVLKKLTLSMNGDLPHRDFLDHVLVYLINASQGSLAVRFCSYANLTPNTAYLQARSLLLNADYQQAAALFARIAGPLVNSAASKAENLLDIQIRRSNLSEYYLHVASLFSETKQFDDAVRFCTEALVVADLTPEMRQATKQSLFSAAVQAKDWSEAYETLACTQHPINKDNLRTFVVALCEAGNINLLLELPFVGMVEEIDAIMERLARNMMDVRSRPSYHKILYAYRMKRSNYRGAATILYHRLQFLHNRTHVDGFNVATHLDITESYLAIINALRCLNVSDAWIIVGAREQDAPLPKKSKQRSSEDQSANVFRKLLKLSDIRLEYDRELRNMEAQLLELKELVG